MTVNVHQLLSFSKKYTLLSRSFISQVIDLDKVCRALRTIAFAILTGDIWSGFNRQLDQRIIIAKNYTVNFTISTKYFSIEYTFTESGL